MERRIAELRTVRDGYDDLADAYADHRTLDGPGTDLVRRFARDQPVESLVLDAGCGGGLPAGRLLDEHHEVVGLDVSTAQLTRLRENVPGAVPVQGEFTGLPFADGAFDALVSLFAVIHVPRERHAEVFAAFHRVLDSDGEALLVVGNDAWEGRNPDWLDTGTEMFWSFYGLETNCELLRDAGFAVEVQPVESEALGDGFRYVRARA
jgi:SAM-dependent methyltransferase